ncbi:hypothetical protein [Xylanimonas protaetiae]|uniref:YcxB family protein n=1 Tax=Xylanimonas protaetiae TaxID=2509457 RepID=A0A4P6F2Y8_9MICO|nr:hypothetical protein [Xylanimonas protaetiae]QAY70210.1 hypothetical protein ET471_09315 [Xylanimonas protaetiae]
MSALAGEDATTAVSGRSVDGVGRPTVRESLQTFPAMLRRRSVGALVPPGLLVAGALLLGADLPGPFWPAGAVGSLVFVVMFTVVMTLAVLLLSLLDVRRTRRSAPRIHLDESGVSVTVSTGVTIALAWDNTRVRFVTSSVVGLRARKGFALMAIPLSAFDGEDRAVACSLLADKLGVEVR